MDFYERQPSREELRKGIDQVKGNEFDGIDFIFVAFAEHSINRVFEDTYRRLPTATEYNRALNMLRNGTNYLSLLRNWQGIAVEGAYRSVFRSAPSAEERLHGINIVWKRGEPTYKEQLSFERDAGQYVTFTTW